MRLQLSIQRHNLPPTQILWTASSGAPTTTSAPTTALQAHPHIASAHPSATVSQLLEDINDVIPLESAEWGLEDYVVEVGGFECLHYMTLGEVLRDGDHVVIRALQTHDLRLRRLGGRHQISGDGRHLIDGVTFGKPYLKRNRRPQVYIPPRKKARLNEAPDEAVGDLAIGQGSEAEDGPVRSIEGAPLPMELGGEDGQSEEDDEDFVESSGSEDDGDDEEDEIQEELRFLKDELGGPPGQDENAHGDIEQEDWFTDRLRDQLKRNGRRVRFYDSLEDGEVVVQQYNTNTRPGQQYVLRRGRKQRSQPQSKGKEVVVYSDTAEADGDAGSKAGAAPTKPTNGVVKAVKVMAEFEDEDDDKKSEEDGQEEDDEDEDDDFEDEDGGDDADSNANEGYTTSETSETSDTSSEEESEDSDPEVITTRMIIVDDEPATNGIKHSMSNSSSANNDLVDQADSTSETSSSSEDDSDSSSDSSSDSDSDMESTSAKDGQDNTVEVSRTIPEPAPMGPHGQGLLRTKKNNLRIRRRKRLSRLKSDGVLSPNANFADMDAYDDSLLENGDEATAPQEDATNDDFEAKRQALLGQLAEQGDAASGMEIQPPTEEQPENGTAVSAVMDGSASDDDGPEELPIAKEPESKEPESTEDASAVAEASARRAKLDVSSSRRLLFGSLGLRAPRNAEEEARLRARFLPEKPKPKIDVEARLQLNRQNKKAAEPKASVASETSVPNVGWESKINLSATECEMDGLELKPPPFPFQQFWDPEAAAKIKAQKGKKRRLTQGPYNDGYIDAPDQYPEEPLDFAALQDESAPAEPTTADAENPPDDLPEPPKDLSTLKPLIQDECLPGAIIVFQELEVSARTNWTPVVSDYQTAQVEGLGEDFVQLQLAQRDIPTKTMSYDQNGQRVYNKFDVPDYYEDGEEDTGIRDIPFESLLNAKLLSSAETENAKESNDSVQRIPESFPEAQETILTHDTPDVSLIAVDEPVNPSGSGSSLLTQTAPPASSYATAEEATEYSIHDVAVERLQSSIDQENVGIDPDIGSPQFHGFSSPPRIEGDIPSGDLSLLDKGDNPMVIDAEATAGEGLVNLEEEAPIINGTLESEPGDHHSSPPSQFDPIASEDGNDEIAAGFTNPPPPASSTNNTHHNNGSESQSLGSTVPASQSQSQPLLRRDSQQSRPFFTGLDGMSSDNESLPSLEKIASQIRASQSQTSSSPVATTSQPSKKGKGKRKATTTDSQAELLGSSPFASGSQTRSKRNASRSQTQKASASQGSTFVDLTQSSDVASIPSSSQGEDEQLESIGGRSLRENGSHGTGWLREHGLSMSQVKGKSKGKGKGKARR